MIQQHLDNDHSIARGTILGHVGAQTFAVNIFLAKANPFETNYSKPLRQPWVDPSYRVYLTHRRSIKQI